MSEGKENTVANWEIIDASDAPALPRAMSKSAQASLEMINALKPGKVIKVSPEEGQTVRGLKSGITRVATNNNKKVVTWDADGVVYLKLA